jgi:cytidine deaminase
MRGTNVGVCAVTATSLQPGGPAESLPVTDEEVRTLVEAARAARDKAYAPYSEFRVGAALLAEDGSVVTGANVENASYGLSMCAERAAVAGAVAAGHRDFRAIAVAAGGTRPTTPCGACRQVLREFPAGTGLVVIAVGETGDEQLQATVGRLLPHGFGPESLREETWQNPGDEPADEPAE